MKITIIGGGPAGLYAAILLKKLDRRHEVTVFERNAPDDTFGFGVVFSDQTLGNLRDADAVTHEQITGAFARWDAIDIQVGGELVRCAGNGFAGIARRHLLALLQGRAEQLGARLVFKTEVDPAEAGAQADLVLAADGVASRVRQHLAGALRPELETSEARYIWLGTTRPFEAFTFVFRETPHGRFQAHAYPYDAEMSTFIVECDAASWRAAGLEDAGEAESIAFCSELFGPELQGHPLVPNRSRWINFVTVRNAGWHTGNVALLGDAAHTAHFSIGSGTKLAMEDAIALARALEPGDELPTALARYESERRPVVERTQEAAAESREWFESWGRHRAFSPPQFAVSLLGRSGRVTYANLRRRDPVLVTALDRWFAARSAGRDPAAVWVASTPAFTPLELAGLRLPNRLVAAPAPDWLATDGRPSAGWLGQLRVAGCGGAAMVLAVLVAVSPDARVTPGCAGLWDDGQQAAWQELAEAVHRAGGRLVLQLSHAGARGATRPRAHGTDWPLRRGWPLVAASPLPYTASSARPAELGGGGMAHIRDAFAASTARAARAGADGIELAAGHGNLLAGFLSPLTNRRTDAFGGPLEHRLRFPLEVLAAVREQWPAGRPLSVCFSASDWAPGGLETPDAVAIAKAFRARGADLVHVVAGQTTSSSRPAYGRAFCAPLSDVVRNEAQVPTMISGNLPFADDVDTVVAAGRADLCVLGRPSPPQPAWLAARAGEAP